MITECERRNNEDRVQLKKQKGRWHSAGNHGDRSQEWEVERTGSESCPVGGLGTSGADRLGSPSSYLTPCDSTFQYNPPRFPEDNFGLEGFQASSFWQHLDDEYGALVEWHWQGKTEGLMHNRLILRVYSDIKYLVHTAHSVSVIKNQSVNVV